MVQFPPFGDDVTGRQVTHGSPCSAQPHLAQRPGTVDTADANNLPKPHRDRSRDHAQTHNKTNNFNVDFPALTSRKATTKPARFVYPSSWLPPPPTPTFPHQHTKKSPQNQHTLPILHVGTRHLQPRLFCIIKPKSHPSSNTSCPLTVKERAYYLNTGNRVDWYPSLWVCLNIWDPTHEDYQVAQRLTWLGYGSRG